jgi:replicative DNA helicase
MTPQNNQLFALDSELAVLSLILRVPELAHSAVGLKSRMFSATTHQNLYEEFEELVEKQLLPDMTLVIASLESKNKLNEAGGKKYIESLYSKEYPESAFEEFVSLVTSSYKARMYLTVTAGADKSKLSADNIDEYISNTRKALEDLTEIRGSLSAIHISDITKPSYEDILSRTKTPGIRGATWGAELKELDSATGGKCQGDLWVVAGRPGSGKTALVCNSVLSDGRAGVPSLLIEREMTNLQLMDRLLALDTGIPNTNIRLGVLDQEQIERIYASLGRLKTYPIYMDTNFRATDPSYLEATVNKFKNKHGIEVVYLDYVQLLSERDENQTQEIGRLTRLFKMMANDKKICNILVSQLNRNVEARDNKRPMLSDMKMSGSLEEDADFAVGLYRDEYYNNETKYKGLMEYIILKHRNGPTGTVTLKFDGPTNKISEAR